MRTCKHDFTACLLIEWKTSESEVFQCSVAVPNFIQLSYGDWDGSKLLNRFDQLRKRSNMFPGETGNGGCSPQKGDGANPMLQQDLKIGWTVQVRNLQSLSYHIFNSQWTFWFDTFGSFGFDPIALHFSVTSHLWNAPCRSTKPWIPSMVWTLRSAVSSWWLLVQILTQNVYHCTVALSRFKAYSYWWTHGINHGSPIFCDN